MSKIIFLSIICITSALHSADDYYGYDAFSLTAAHRVGHKHKVVRSVEEALKIELSGNTATRQTQQNQLNATFLAVADTEHLDGKEKYAFLSSLLDKGAQANSKDDKTNNTALIMLVNNLAYAPKESHDTLYDCMQLLINKDIDVNQQGYTGQTALHVACETAQPSLKVVEALVAAKADLTIKDQRGFTVLETKPLLASWENPEVIRFLEQVQVEQQKIEQKAPADDSNNESGLRSKYWQNMTDLRRAKTILETRKAKKSQK